MLKRILFLFAAMMTVCAFAESKSMVDAHIDSTLKSNKVIFIDGKPAPEDTQHYLSLIHI